MVLVSTFTLVVNLTALLEIYFYALSREIIAFWYHLVRRCCVRRQNLLDDYINVKLKFTRSRTIMHSSLENSHYHVRLKVMFQLTL